MNNLSECEVKEWIKNCGIYNWSEEEELTIFLEREKENKFLRDRWSRAMPRCCNDNKAVSPVSTNKKNTANIVLTPSRFPIGNPLEFDINNRPLVEKSHRRLRCDLSPVPTNSNGSISIKLIGLKVLIISKTSINN